MTSAPDTSRVLHRNIRHPPPRAVRGDGVHIIDAAGRRYLDGSSGAAVSCLGHSHPRLVEALARQAEELAFVHTGFFTTEPLERLAERLASDAPGDLRHAFFVSGGSEAMEAAVKIARQSRVESGQPQRTKVIARRQSYHGNTLGALAVSGHAARRRIYEPLLTPTLHVGDCHAYRGQAPGEPLEAYGRRMADELEATILAAGPDTVLAFVAETIVGATLGAAPPAPGYFRQVRRICDHFGVLLILDEVMCGMGRCGTLHACEAEGIAPDLMTLAKGLGAGYQPIGAVLASSAIAETLTAGSGQLRHGHTYGGHASACAVALAVQDTIRDENLLANVQARGEQLITSLRSELGDHPRVGDIRGRGLFLGVEFVADRETKRPFPPQDEISERVRAAAFDQGLLIYPGSGSADGRAGDHVIIAPPYIVTGEETDDLVRRFTLAARKVLGPG